MKTILVVATLDTKATEAGFIKKRIEDLGAKTLLLDGGVLDSPRLEPDVTRKEVAASAGYSMEEIRSIKAEAVAIKTMAIGAGKIALKLHQEGKIHGIIGVGGGMGTAFGSHVMRALPIGVPKVMVTPQGANPDVVRNAVRTKDLCMFNAVTDVVGLNQLTEVIFSRAAGAVVGMANIDARQQESSDKKMVLFSAKGTTEPANIKIRERIVAAGYTPMTFHCWGYGPEAVEEIIKGGYINGGVIEYASDWLDRIAGGSSYPPDDRYENAGKLRLPQIFVPGSCDFVVANPGTFPERNSQPHNQAAELFRSKKEELRRTGREVGEKLSKGNGHVTVVIPLRGFSICDGNGGPLTDLDADSGFIEGISPYGGKIKIKQVDAHIHDDEFADAVMEAFLENVALTEGTGEGLQSITEAI